MLGLVAQEPLLADHQGDEFALNIARNKRIS